MRRLWISLLGFVLLFISVSQTQSPTQCGPQVCYNGCGSNPQIDFVFLVDGSTSMDPQINATKLGLIKMANDLSHQNFNMTFSLVVFGSDPEYGIRGLIELHDNADTNVTSMVQSINNIIINGAWEPGLETIRCAMNTANENNLNIAFRPGARKIFILVTDEDSDPPYYVQNRVLNDRTWQSQCDSAYFDSKYQPELNEVAKEVVQQNVTLYLAVPSDDRFPDTCLTFRQYGDSNIQSQNPDFSNFNATATLINLQAAGLQNSLQGQLLKNGLIARVFDGAQLDTFDLIFKEITGEIIECKQCFSYQCSVYGTCLPPINICGCDGVPYSGTVEDPNGNCCHKDTLDCGGFCPGSQTTSYLRDPCGVCTLNGVLSASCKLDCNNNYYLVAKPPTVYQTPCPGAANYLVQNADLQARYEDPSDLTMKNALDVCQQFSETGQFEGRFICTFDTAYYSSTNGVPQADAETHWLGPNGLLSSLPPDQKPKARCLPGSRRKLPPLEVDDCGQCIINDEAHPFCVRDCLNILRTSPSTVHFVDNCENCVAPGTNPDAAKDFCGVCEGNNQTLNACGTCGNVGKDGCGQSLCLNLPCGTDCDGVPRNPLLKKVDECNQCVDITQGRDPNCVQNCAGLWYLNGTEDSSHKIDKCGYCISSALEHSASCTDCRQFPCENGGVCYLNSTSNKYLCDCPSSFHGSRCQNVSYCMGMFKDNAFFSLAVEGTYSFGVCLDGFSGAPTLYCDSNNHWSSTTTGSLCTAINPVDPITVPTCRCNKYCGLLGISNCNSCYQNGGLVLPSNPNSCYCQSTQNFLKSSGQQITETCQSPLPSCVGCYDCHPNCLSCFGPNSDQCLFCPSDRQFVATLNPDGSLNTGQCVKKCPDGQINIINSNICASPDCSGFGGCGSNGDCKFKLPTLASVPSSITFSQCQCNQGYTGTNCEISLDCSEFNNCNNNGICTDFFGYKFCDCHSGFGGTNCSEIINAYSPKVDTNFGGMPITTQASLNQATCHFGSISVSPISQNSQSIVCEAPPSFLGNVRVDFSVSDNQNTLTFPNDPFYYVDTKPFTIFNEQQLERLFWDRNDKMSFSWDPLVEGFDDIVYVSLYQWSWNPFTTGRLNDPTRSLVLSNIAIGPNNGQIQLDISPYTNLTFTWENALYQVGIHSGTRTLYYNVVILDPNFDFDSKCNSFTQNAPRLNVCNTNQDASTFVCPTSYPSQNPLFVPDSNCNNQTCFLHGQPQCLTSIKTYSNDAGDSISFTCCYPSGSAPVKIFGSYGPLTGMVQQTIKQFIGDMLPKFFCCQRSSALACTNFRRKRETPPATNICNLKRSLEPDSSLPFAHALCYGDPHFLTFDNKYWSFNAQGEFTLLKTSATTIQGRFEKFESTTATSLTALIISEAGSYVSFYTSTDSPIVIYLGENKLPLKIDVGSYYTTANGITIFNIQDDQFNIILPSGISIILLADYGVLGFVTIFPSELKGIDTYGLLGNWNDNMNDEFKFLDGTTYPIDSNESLIYSNFGLSYALTQAESLFKYPNGKNFDDYNDLDFIPSFTTEFANSGLELQAELACEGTGLNKDACLFDVAQMNSILATHLSLRIGAIHQNLLNDFNLPPSIQVQATQVDVHFGEAVVIPFNVQDKENDNYLISADTLLQGRLDTQNNQYSFDVTTQMYQDNLVPSLTLIATDSKGFSSSVEITFKIVPNDCNSMNQLLMEMLYQLQTSCTPGKCSDQCKQVLANYMTLPCYENLQKLAGENEKYLTETQASCCDNTIIPCKGLSGGAIAGIVIGILVFVCLILGLVYYFYYRKLPQEKRFKTPSFTSLASNASDNKGKKTSYEMGA